jgi:hypothetical protein
MRKNLKTWIAIFEFSWMSWSLGFDRSKRFVGNLLRTTPSLVGNLREITSQRLQRVSFVVDFRRSSKSKTPEDGQRRAPTLHSVLKQERAHDCRQGKPPAINSSS